VPQGFGSTPEYNEASSSLQHLPHVRTPTLLLVSTDDPFLGVLPDAECAANPYTLLAATSRGGHVAFLQGGLLPLGSAFMDFAVLQFFEATLEHYHREDDGCRGAACTDGGDGGTTLVDLAVRSRL